MRLTRTILAVCLVMGVGCVRPTPTPTTAAPTPPQVNVANAINLLATSLDGALTVAIAAQQAGKLPQSDLDMIEAYFKSVATWGKTVNAELRTTDTWDVMRAKIATAAISMPSVIYVPWSAAAKTYVNGIQMVVNQVLVLVGIGPISVSGALHAPNYDGFFVPRYREYEYGPMAWVDAWDHR